MYSGVPRTDGTQDNLRPDQLGSGRDHPNALMLREAHSAFQGGNLEKLFALFADDIVWVLPGDNVLSGRYVGREGVMRNFAQLQANVDSYWAQGIDYFGSDDHAVLVARVSARRGTETLDCLECLLFKVVDGKFTQCWHMALDDRAWETFFAKR